MYNQLDRLCFGPIFATPIAVHRESPILEIIYTFSLEMSKDPVCTLVVKDDIDKPCTLSYHYHVMKDMIGDRKQELALSDLHAMVVHMMNQIYLALHNGEAGFQEESNQTFDSSGSLRISGE